MGDIDGLDVKPGMKLRHPKAGLIRVDRAERRQVKMGAWNEIVNIVDVTRLDNGATGQLQLRAGQTFKTPDSGSAMGRAMKGTNPVDFNNPAARKL